METTEVFDGGGTEGSPAASMFSFLLWPGQRLFYQFRTDMLGVAIPGVRKISQGCPGVFSLANALVGIDHGIDSCRERWWFFVPVSVILRHHAEGFKFHGQPLLPKAGSKRFRYFRRASAVQLVKCIGLILVGLVHVSESLFSGVV